MTVKCSNAQPLYTTRTFSRKRASIELVHITATAKNRSKIMIKPTRSIVSSQRMNDEPGTIL